MRHQAWTMALLLAPHMTSSLAAAELPVLRWRGSLWISGQMGDKNMTDGSVPFRVDVPKDGQFAFDGATLGCDADLGKGISVRATLLGGHTAKIMNALGARSEGNGNITLSEAQLLWTGGSNKLTIGRMNSYLGMECIDATQNIAASRGLLYNHINPMTQVGLVWRHTFNKDWSTDAMIFNGEDRVNDNNRCKTFGGILNYNHGGATEKYVTLHAYRGSEQDAFGTAINTGAEGRQRERLAVIGQWIWGPSTLQWEGSLGREPFVKNNVKFTDHWQGYGCIYRYGFNDTWGVFGRGELLKNDHGSRAFGPENVSVEKVYYEAKSLAVGGDFKYSRAFTRLELRRDSMNKDNTDQDGKPFRNALSATLCVGANF